jgi:membrane associated rhomboid family serine protease
VNIDQRNSIIVSSFIIVIPLIFVTLASGISIIGLLASIFLMALILPLPLSDSGTVRYQTVPWVTIVIIILNTILLFWWQGYLDAFSTYTILADGTTVTDWTDFEQHLWAYGIRDRYIYDGYSIGAFNSITAVFMHGDHNHLIGNMVFLWAFGRRLEDACGHWRYLTYYLIAGIIAGLGSIYLSPPHPSGFDVPSIGASGAVFGVMGAYLILFPTSRIQSFWSFGIFPLRPLIMFFAYALEEDKYKPFRWTINLPSIIVVGLYAWFNLSDAGQILDGAELHNAGGTLAHVSGFLASILIFLFVRKDLLRRYLKGRNL